jgi:uncharacterized lipoprotein YddW (UPF0748 family)
VIWALLTALCPFLFAQQPPTEVRALWVQRATLTSPEAIRTLVATARSSGFNTLLVQVRGRGDAYYQSRYEPRPAALAKQPASFDPLQTVLDTAHAEGLRVHAWMNVNLISDAEPSSLPDHLVRKHPEWLMVPRELSADLLRMDARHPEYLDALSRYARAHKDRIEGLYASPVLPEAAEYTLKVFSDVAARYPVDGIHLDYVRFPNAEFDYSAGALAQFRRYLQRDLTDAERREYDARARREPLFYTQMFPQRWVAFRQERVTDLVSRLRVALKARRPAAILSAAVIPDAEEAATRRMQNWGGWIHDGLLDVVCPMAYTMDPIAFRSQVLNVQRVAGSKPVWAGIGAFQLSALETILNIRAARQAGAQGVVLFSYDNLVAFNDYFAAVRRDAFTE